MSEDVIAFILSTLNELSFDVDEAGADTPLGPYGIDLDSLAVVELAARVSAAYGVTFTGQDMERMAMATVGEFAAAIVERRDAVPAAGRTP